jgi:alkylhydroperoxidase family enzyme
MKRATLVEYDVAPGDVQAIYDEIMETLGSQDIPNVFKALGNNENILRAVWSMLKNTLVEGEIPALLKELVLFRISVQAGNEYCTSLHAHAACRLDSTLKYDDLKALSEGEALPRLPASYQVALDIISRAALKPKSVANDDFELEEELRDAGFSEREIDELLAVGYFAVMMNTVTDSYDIPWDAPYPPETSLAGT